jgi:hypothetical protein
MGNTLGTENLNTCRGCCVKVLWMLRLSFALEYLWAIPSVPQAVRIGTIDLNFRHCNLRSRNCIMEKVPNQLLWHGVTVICLEDYLTLRSHDSFCALFPVL